MIPCIHCEEDVDPGCDEVYVYVHGQVAHRECHIRGCVGSVAHLEKRCECFVPGSTDSDPPEMTRRQAAKAATDLWESMTGYYFRGYI